MIYEEAKKFEALLGNANSMWRSYLNRVDYQYHLNPNEDEIRLCEDCED
jgi:hypothetical protein